ncbi:MAG TPA: DNA lesion error-prone repair protein ImuA, partial [Rhodanobacteraceae bacterium]|nr:DNA lesion error-prone repair protein ImuA [Rhodanobacteraceae bacterium]
MSAILQPLIEAGRLWRGQGTAPRRDALPTGFDALDRVLPGGGWPRAALSEILFPADGVGELRLLLPALAMLSREARPIVLVAPPYLPFPAAWIAAGMDLRYLQIV